MKLWEWSPLCSGPTCPWSPVDATEGWRGSVRSAGRGEGLHTAQSAMHWVECHWV